MKIALYQGTDPVSMLIRWQTRSQYSHSALLTDNGEVIEATMRPFPRGSVARVAGLNAQHAEGTKVDIFESLAAHDEMKSDKWLEQQIGKRYDYRSVFRFMTRVPADENQAYYCSELVFGYFQAGDLNLLERIEAHNVRPCDLAYSPFLRLVETVVLG